MQTFLNYLIEAFVYSLVALKFRVEQWTATCFCMRTNLTRVKRCTAVEYTYFPNVFFSL